jgi:integrase
MAFLKHHVLPRFGSKHLDQITTQAIAEAYNDMRAKGYAQSTANNLPSMLKIIFNIAHKRRTAGADFNPAVDVKIKNPHNARQRFLSLEEVQRLREAIDQSLNPQLKYIVNLLLLLCCRKRELLDAKWADFDIERRNWLIPMSKSGKPRNVPLSTAVIQTLAQLPRWPGCPWVVPNPATLRPFVSFYASWNEARKRSGLEDVTVHTLRHSGASHLLAAGADLLTVSRVLGHASIRQSEVYTHIGNPTLLRSMEALGTLVGTNVEIPRESPSHALLLAARSPLDLPS